MMAGTWVERVAIVLLPVVLGVGLLSLARRTSLGRASTWQRQASPGPLSTAHSFPENNCAACHTPVKGPESAQCIACHANDVAVLQRETTAFHARIGSCRDCHFEHRGADEHLTLMDHDARVRMALRPARPKERGTAEAEPLRDQLASWINHSDHTG
jgi:Class III cytochrome C family